MLKSLFRKPLLFCLFFSATILITSESRADETKKNYLDASSQFQFGLFNLRPKTADVSGFEIDLRTKYARNLVSVAALGGFVDLGFNHNRRDSGDNTIQENSFEFAIGPYLRLANPEAVVSPFLDLGTGLLIEHLSEKLEADDVANNTSYGVRLFVEPGLLFRTLESIGFRLSLPYVFSGLNDYVVHEIGLSMGVAVFW